MLDRFIAASQKNEDAETDNTLRPKRMQDYIGQQKIKERLNIFIQAALYRNESLDHVLLYGPPGLGKTTLAAVIANELDVQIRTTSGPAVERQGDLAALLTNLQPNDILFIDEIHRLNRAVEEILYPAMEDFALDLIIGKGPSAKSLRLALAPFTLIGATTRAGLLSSPLRERFGVVSRLDFYQPEELKNIIERSAKVLKIKIDPEAAKELAERSRGTPRIAIRLLKRVRDYAQVRAKGIVTREVSCRALKLLEVDEAGLDNVDRTLLAAIIEKFQGGPVGLETVAATIGEESGTVEEVYEPFLIQKGYLARTPRGRIATRLAYSRLGLKSPAHLQQLELDGI